VTIIVSVKITTASVLAAQSVLCTADQAGCLRLPRPVVREGCCSPGDHPRGPSADQSKARTSELAAAATPRCQAKTRIALKCFTPSRAQTVTPRSGSQHRGARVAR
jgi:hypothetical protein